MDVMGQWLRWELRLRWRSLAVLAALVAVSAAVVLAAGAGARRGDTAVDRLEAATLPATAQVVPYSPGFDWNAVRRLPEVIGLSTFADSTSFSIDGVASPYAAGGPPADPDAMRTVERPVVIAGRRADPSRADEATVSPAFVRMYGFGVGDTITAHLYSAEQARRMSEGSPAPDTATGPTVRIRIVGVVLSPWYFDDAGFEGQFYASPGLAASYPENIIGRATPEAGSLGALVRLRRGDADLPAFQQHLSAIAGRRDVTIRALSEFAHRHRHSTTYEAAWLLAFAAAAAAASALLIGQALARHVAFTVADLQRLAAVGMTPAQLMRTAATAPVLAVAVGGVIGTGLAVYASRWFPIGSAAALEPRRGFAVDPLMLGAGLLAVLLLGVAVAAASARLYVKPPRRQPPRPSPVATAATRAGLPVTTVVGAWFALGTGRGRSGTASRPALIGAVAGLTGVLAALTLAAGVQDAAGNPARFGETWDLFLPVGQGGEALPGADAVLAAAAADPGVTGVNDARIGVAEVGDTAVSTTVFSLTPVGRPLEIVTTDGRAPATAGEILLGPETARIAGVGVGSTIRMAGTRDGQASMTVTGLGFVPQWIDSSYHTGGWVTGAGFDRLFTGYDYRIGFLVTRGGAGRTAVLNRLNARIQALPGGGDTSVEPTDRLAAMDEVARVSRMPSVLGVFLGLLAIGAVGHALVTAVRGRRQELAVLRALGMTPGGLRGVLATQASLLALVGLALGIPLGVALGRTVWRTVAAYTPLFYVPPRPLPGLLLIAPAALLLANVLAAWPGHRAARMPVAPVLKAE
jgi:hypothetical protein